MKIIQCWDDGVTADIPLIELLKKHHSKATFNLNAGLHQSTRKVSGSFKETEVVKLSQGELADVYEGFTIANHSLTHPYLETLPLPEARVEIKENRKQLQDIFSQPIHGFAYPFGTYSDAVEEIVKDEGHIYARTVKNTDDVSPLKAPFAFEPSCHFLADNFWEKYEAAKITGIFYFWGHSYELISETMWSSFEANLKKMDEDSDAEWAEILDIFI